MKYTRFTFLLAVVTGLLTLWNVSVFAQDDDPVTEARAAVQDTDSPRRHFRTRDISELSPDEAERIYQIIRGALGVGYASSGREKLSNYQELTRHNSAPYVSATHGNLYLNNYTNANARDYEKFEGAGVLPEGSVIYKDSFTVTEIRQSFSGGVSRQITLGPLFIMRKMEKGFNPVTGDWQYMQIQPDGQLLGMTRGEGAQYVEYCIGCHLAREEYDHLYFVPDEYR